MQNLSLLFRSILVGRLYSLVSVIGLSIAIAAVILVSALVQHEFSYEKAFSSADRIYRLNWINNGTGDRFATMFNPFSPQFADETADVAAAARVGVFEVLLERRSDSGQRAFGDLEEVAFADPAFFELFDFDFESGGAANSLADIHSVVLTRASANKYFPDGDALGQTLTLESNTTLTVTAIIETIPANTHFPFHYIVPLENVRTIFNGAGWLDSWGSDSLYHYVLLQPGADGSMLDRRLDEFRTRHDSYREWDVSIVAQPLTDVHFMPDLQNEMPVRDAMRNILKAPRKASDLAMFSAGALVLVLIASFNFMNLQIARGFGRSRQLGLLKVVGASRAAVFRRMLAESVLFALLSLIVAIMLVELSLGLFGRTIAVTLSWSDVLQPTVIIAVVVLTLFLGLASGAYPAWLMAAQKPNLILKGEFAHGHGVRRIRQLLVLLQFTVSIVLIAVSLGIYAQIRFTLSAPIGFQSEGVLVVPINRPEVDGNFDTLKVRIEEHPEVSLVTQSSIIPTGNLSDGASLDPDGSGPLDPVAMRMVRVDYDFFAALNIDLVAGRSFHRDFGGEAFVFPSAENPVSRTAIIINEMAARRAGWTNSEDAIGKEMRNDFTYQGNALTLIGEVIGVSRDVHFRSLRTDVVPMLFVLGQRGNHMLIKTAAGNLQNQDVVAHVETVWAETVPELPIRQSWLSDSVAQLYDQESRILKLMSGVSVVGIAVACLGLFAVASLATEARRKELALRKVFGASMISIINLLSFRFLQAVVLASLLAWPVAWLTMNRWLSGFVYRIEPGVLHFLAPGVIALIIAWLTVAAQALIVARNRPIESLHYE